MDVRWNRRNRRRRKSRMRTALAMTGAVTGLFFAAQQLDGRAETPTGNLEDIMLKVEGTPGELIFGTQRGVFDEGATGAEENDRESQKSGEGSQQTDEAGQSSDNDPDKARQDEETAQKAQRGRDAHRFLTTLPEGFRYPMTLEAEGDRADREVEGAMMQSDQGLSLLTILENQRQLPGIRPVYPNEQFAEIPYAELMKGTENKSFAMLETMLKLRLASYDGDWSVYVKNLETAESVVINDQPMKSASVMKLFILGTVYEAMERGELARTDEVMSLMELMITVSDNEASNQLLYLLGDGSYEAGIAKVNAFIHGYGYSAQTIEYNGFSNSATVMDSSHFNQVTAKDCGRLLEDIYRRAWGSRAISNEIEELLLNQQTRYKIPAGLPEGVLCGNKTGEMETTENDAAIIFGEECDYILVVLSSDWASKAEAIDRIASLSKLVYGFLN